MSCRTSLDEAREAVNKLYSFRDRYFEAHEIEQAINKAEDVGKELQLTLSLLDKLQDDITNKADYLMLRGKALNINSDYDPLAEEMLSKAVKLDPKLSDAWIALGECYWKNRDIESARNCFIGAMNHCEDKVALRNLSMVLRQCAASPEERGKLVEESVEKAKKAVQLDVNDGTSWTILGNAYLSLFFSAGQSTKVLKKCMSAYQQAERDSIAACSADLHYNRAIGYKFQEEYLEALVGFSKAGALDPTWPDPKAKETLLLGYLSKLDELVHAKGCIKGKKLKSLVDSIRDSHLGPYGGGSYTSGSGMTVTLEAALLDQLSLGSNTCKVVMGKVVCSVQSEEPIPFTFCMVDRESQCFAVTVYNIAPGWGVKIGDTVAIPEPFVQQVNVNYNDKVFKFGSVRVGSPVVMVVNGRKLGMDTHAPSVLGVSAFSD